MAHMLLPNVSALADTCVCLGISQMGGSCGGTSSHTGAFLDRADDLSFFGTGMYLGDQEKYNEY